MCTVTLLPAEATLTGVDPVGGGVSVETSLAMRLQQPNANESVPCRHEHATTRRRPHSSPPYSPPPRQERDKTKNTTKTPSTPLPSSPSSSSSSWTAFSGLRRFAHSKKNARVRSILFMATASALHMAGFELARGATLTLFTSQRTGFSGSPAASPISTVCMTPFSVLLLWLYTQSLDRWGPHKALCLSTLAFAMLLAIGGGILDTLGSQLVMVDDVDDDDTATIIIASWKQLAQATTFILHVTSNAFVQLLYTQHWSFLVSVIVADDRGATNVSNKDYIGGAMWFAPIAGLASVASTLSGLCVPPLVDRFGLTGLLLASSLVLLLSCACADQAYRIAIWHRFEPGHHSGHTTQPSSKSQHQKQDSLYQSTLCLFTRVPILASLCVEVFTSQSVSSIIHFLFMLKVQKAIPNDAQRAGWTGRCYAWINACSGLLQFLVLPLLMRIGYDRANNTAGGSQQRKLWLIMPATIMVCATLLIYEKEISLSLVTATFSLYKVLEYSVRAVAMETMYASLDYESRFLGKELIGLLVDRVGRSSAALVLSCITNIFGLSPLLDKALVQALSVSSLLWLFASYPLANYGQQPVVCRHHPKRKKKLHNERANK